MVKKVMFSYFSKCLRPQNAAVRKRWHDKIHNGLEHSQVRNWQRDTLDHNKWRDIINKKVQVKPPSINIVEIVKQIEKHTQDQRATNGKRSLNKETQVLVPTANKDYNCSKCNKSYKPQGIANHVRSCATEWCQQNTYNSTVLISLRTEKLCLNHYVHNDVCYSNQSRKAWR